MVSPFQGTPNMPLQLDSITKECVPWVMAEGGMMYSTRRSPPYPPVMPVEGESRVQFSRRAEGEGRTLKRRAVCGVYHGFASGVEFNWNGLMRSVRRGREEQTLDARVLLPVGWDGDEDFPPVVCLCMF